MKPFPVECICEDCGAYLYDTLDMGIFEGWAFLDWEERPEDQHISLTFGCYQCGHVNIWHDAAKAIQTHYQVETCESE